ncbi:MAG: hypothetical protein KGO49_11290 [Gammaproteobacteria bacterium]|nr:hypothetical protein [Gammaproteobacteria bacterium]
MKRLLIALCICFSPFAQAETLPSQSQSQAAVLNPAMSNAIYLYSQAAYQQAVMQQRNCDQFNASEVNAIDQRLANTRIKILSLYGKKAFRKSPPTSTVVPAECNEEMIKIYSDHVSDLEKFLNSAS